MRVGKIARKASLSSTFVVVFSFFATCEVMSTIASGADCESMLWLLMVVMVVLRVVGVRDEGEEEEWGTKTVELKKRLK